MSAGLRNSLLRELLQVEDFVTGDAMLGALYWGLDGVRPCGYKDVLGLHRRDC